jgi:hypothetical protein
MSKKRGIKKSPFQKTKSTFDISIDTVPFNRSFMAWLSATTKLWLLGAGVLSVVALLSIVYCCLGALAW